MPEKNVIAEMKKVLPPTKVNRTKNNTQMLFICLFYGMERKKSNAGTDNYDS